MTIVRDDNEELVIFSPARGARIAGVCLLIVGLFVALLMGVPILRGGLLSLQKTPPDMIWGLPAAAIMIPAGALLCLIPISGLGMLIKARDTAYRFQKLHKRLLITGSRRERSIPFSEITKAENYESGGNDEPTAYGLRLKLRGIGRFWQMTQVDRSGEVWSGRLSELAGRINACLGANEDRQS